MLVMAAVGCLGELEDEDEGRKLGTEKEKVKIKRIEMHYNDEERKMTAQQRMRENQ